jgi:hypothetical protein
MPCGNSSYPHYSLLTALCIGLPQQKNAPYNTSQQLPFVALFCAWRTRFDRSSHTPEMAQGVC